MSQTIALYFTAEERVQEMKPDEMFQFERFGYCRVDTAKPFVAYFTQK